MDLSQVVGRSGQRIKLKVRLSPGQDPVTIEVPEDMTINTIETMLARKLSRNPENIRLCFRNKPIEKSLTSREVAEMIGPEGVLENIPIHELG